MNTGDWNAYIASLIAKANELYGSDGNVAVAKDGLDLLKKISAFTLVDFLLKIDGWPVGGTVSGSVMENNTYAAGTATQPKTLPCFGPTSDFRPTIRFMSRVLLAADCSSMVPTTTTPPY